MINTNGEGILSQLHSIQVGRDFDVFNTQVSKDKEELAHLQAELMMLKYKLSQMQGRLGKNRKMSGRITKEASRKALEQELENLSQVLLEEAKNTACEI